MAADAGHRGPDEQAPGEPAAATEGAVSDAGHGSPDFQITGEPAAAVEGAVSDAGHGRPDNQLPGEPAAAEEGAVADADDGIGDDQVPGEPIAELEGLGTNLGCASRDNKGTSRAGAIRPITSRSRDAQECNTHQDREGHPVTNA